ncbi:MAG: AraC family transcriptional regulator [Hahellaceae bacterium]|nr:AraC family transcriptional regulator [Hahellaceae bacterium]MCP5169133.1 AraC family transcriptional regulator [Hahellaceae bacterium]
MKAISSLAKDAIVFATYGEILFELALEKGVDGDLLLERSGIRESVLRNPDAMLSNEQFVALVRHTLEMTATPSLGLSYGARLTFTTHGSMAQAAISSESLGKALVMLEKYYRIRFAFIEWKFFTEGDEAVLQLDENLGLEDLTPFVVECLFVALMMVNFLLFGTKLMRTGRCLLSYPRPDYADEYDTYFHASVEFDQPVNQLRFDKQFLDLPLALSNPVAQRVAEKDCEAQLRSLAQHETIVIKVKRMLQSEQGPIPSMEDVADMLHMTSRTLRRQLQSFDTSFQDILNEVRKKRALAMLRATDKSVDDIAHALGYSDPSNFGRAFRKWTGKSPSDFRV